MNQPFDSAHGKKGFSAIALIIIVGVLVFAGAFGVRYLTQKGEDETANWEIYESKHGFSVKYPPGWRIDLRLEQYESLAVAQKISGNHFSVYSYPEDKYRGMPGLPVPKSELKVDVWIYDNINKSLNEWVKSLTAPLAGVEDVIRVEDAVIGDKAVKKVWTKDYEGGPEPILGVYYLEGIRGVRFFSYPSNTQYLEEFNNMIKTFRFVK